MPHHCHPPAAADLPDLANELRRKLRKVTGQRQAILEILRRHPHPLTNREIFNYLPSRNCDLATIYRSMHLLQQMGMVKRFDFGDGIARYELVRKGENEHHHHLICTQCASVVEIDDCFPERLEKRIGRKNGFKSVTHKLEFFGVCPACQS